MGTPDLLTMVEENVKVVVAFMIGTATLPLGLMIIGIPVFLVIEAVGGFDQEAPQPPAGSKRIPQKPGSSVKGKVSAVSSPSAQSNFKTNNGIVGDLEEDRTMEKIVAKSANQPSESEVLHENKDGTERVSSDLDSNWDEVDESDVDDILCPMIASG